MKAARLMTTVLLTAVLSTAALGCGGGGGGGNDDTSTDSDAPTDTAGDPDATDGDAADAEADAAGDGTLTVLVTGPDEWPGYDPQPIEGALVAFDAPGGGRTEKTTGADGRATFDGFDWAAGTAAVTGWKEGSGLASRVGLAASDDGTEVALALPNVAPWPRADWVRVHGTATAIPAGATALGVWANVPCVWNSGSMPDWSIYVPPDVPFTVLSNANGAGGLLDWALVDQPAVTAETTVDLDFTTPATSASVSGSFPIPARADSPLRTGTGQVNVQWGRHPNGHGWFERTAYIGYHSSIAKATDGSSFDYEIKWVSPSWAEEPATRFNILAPSGTNMDPSASAWVDGFPVAGPQDFAFLDAPRLIEPAVPSADNPLHDPIEWELFDTGVQVELQILRDNGATAPLTALWIVQAPVDATTLVVPALPTGVDYTVALGSGNLIARLRIISETPLDDFYLRMATSQRFYLVGP